jgi:hypothetical protein
MSTRRRLSTLAVAAALAAAGCGGDDDAVQGTETEPEGQSPSLVDPAGNEPGSTTAVPEPDGR